MENRILGLLPVTTFKRLEPCLRESELASGQVLAGPAAPLAGALFVQSGIVSLIADAGGGAPAEVATIGREGMLGVPEVFGAIVPYQCSVELPGRALSIDLVALREIVEQDWPLRRLLNGYSQALLIQAWQLAACNARHSVEQRLARWLLACGDRVDADEISLTHEWLSHMLGVRRAGVTLAIHILEGHGAIRAARKSILIRDRLTLETLSCGCYRAMRSEFDRIIAARSPEMVS
jgi:CRP-like cAMP-binding protein